MSIIAKFLARATGRRDVPNDRVQALVAEIADLQAVLAELPAEEANLQSAMAARPDARDALLLADAPRREIDQHDRETAALADQMAALRLFAQQQQRRIATLAAERDQLRVEREIEKWQAAAAKLLNSMTVACADFEALLSQTNNVRNAGLENSFIGHCPPPPRWLDRDLIATWSQEVARAAPGWKPAEISAPARVVAHATQPAPAGPPALAASGAPPVLAAPDPVPLLLASPPAADESGRVAVTVLRAGLETDDGRAQPAGRIISISAQRAHAAVRAGSCDYAPPAANAAPVPPAGPAPAEVDRTDAAAPAAAAIVEEITQ